MAKFILLYNGPATPPEQMAPEQVQKVMGNWKVWMEKVGGALVDMGQPMVGGVAVVDNGTTANVTQLNGYSIIEADNIEAAKDLVSEHPFLSDKTGDFSVEVHELAPAPM